MPIYEYRCESCGTELEKIQKFSDAPLTDCPACGKASLKKLVSASSFRLKGSGWYETDFKDKKKSAPSTTTSTGNSSSSNSTSGESSSKPATEKSPASDKSASSSSTTSGSGSDS